MRSSLSLLIAVPALAGCGGVDLADRTRTVAAPREEVFASMFGDDGAFAGMPLVSNGGSSRLYELVIDKNHPQWAQVAPKQRPDAHKVTVAIRMEIPRKAHLIYDVDNGALRTGLHFAFEELGPRQTRVSFTTDGLSGDDTEGLTVNSAALRRIARDALGKLDRFDEAPGAA